MVCLWCKEYCGDQGYCGSDCFEQHQEALAEYQAQSECEALLNPEPPPFNEAFGNKS